MERAVCAAVEGRYGVFYAVGVEDGNRVGGRAVVEGHGALVEGGGYGRECCEER